MEDVPEEVGLFLIVHYMQVKRQTIANFIVNRPIFGYCDGEERKMDFAPAKFGGSN